MKVDDENKFHKFDGGNKWEARTNLAQIKIFCKDINSRKQTIILKKPICFAKLSEHWNGMLSQ